MKNKKNKIKFPFSFYIYKYSLCFIVFYLLCVYSIFFGMKKASLVLFFSYLVLTCIVKRNSTVNFFIYFGLSFFYLFLLFIGIIQQPYICTIVAMLLSIITGYLLYRLGALTYREMLKIEETVINLNSYSECELRLFANSIGLNNSFTDVFVLRVSKHYSWKQIKEIKLYDSKNIFYCKKLLRKKLKIRI